MSHSEIQPTAPSNIFDLCVIGGGINGAGIARDAAGRGLSVLLAEAGDLAGATSSASTKLIHGGLRYLEYYEFGLVRAALHERDVLMQAAPHIIRPLEFVLPHSKDLRPAWMLRAGLFLYDHLAPSRKLGRSRRIGLVGHIAGAPLNPEYKEAFTYADCWADDARLVVLNAIDAAERGAQVMTRTRCVRLVPDTAAMLWEVTLKNELTGQVFVRYARHAVNAAGPWVRALLDDNRLVHQDTPKVRLVKGSHIVVPRLYEGGHAYMLQQPDRRIVFAIPYERQYTLIGTTEVDYFRDPAEALISGPERDYLLQAVNRSFKNPVDAGDIKWTYSGVRPLVDDGHAESRAVTRDYILHQSEHDGLPLLSVFGGKLTTYRVLAQKAAGLVASRLGCSGPAWTVEASLPGGDIGGDFEKFAEAQRVEYPWLAEDLLLRYARAYGTRMDDILAGAKDMTGLGRHYGDGIYEAEIRHLIESEWAKKLDDVLWRRSKLGLHAGAATLAALEESFPVLLKDMTS